ncbi:MAG: hypothetical protein AAF501_13525 [Pseudomonadota bacterium]
MAWLTLREIAKGRTLIAGTPSMLGVAIIVSEGVGTGEPIGDLLAVAMTLGNSASIVLIRKFSDAPVAWGQWRIGFAAPSCRGRGRQIPESD